MTDQDTSELGKAIQEVSEKASLLVREEIALAKAELTQKLSGIARGAAIGALILLAVVAGFVAARLFRKGTPPTPQMAIEEAQLIKATLTAPHPATPTGAIQPVQPAKVEAKG